MKMVFNIMVRRRISHLIKKAIKELQKEGVFSLFKIPVIQVEYPSDRSYGDYSTNLAMVLAKFLNKKPREIAEILVKKIQGGKTERFFKKIEIGGGGFINFFLSENYLKKQVAQILKEGKNFGQLKIGRNIKTQVEFISANPTGPLHIGNGRGAFFGDVLSNVLKKAGYEVEREYFINDAKSNSQIKTLGQTALGKGEIYLNEYLKSHISDLKTKLERISDEGEAGYLLAQRIQKDIKNFIEKRLKIKFDNWVSEEKLYEESKIKKIYQWLKKKKLVYEKEGAEWLKISKFGAQKDEVIVRKTGEPTYFLSDIAYHKDKFDRGFQKIINIWGADHQGHVQKIKAVAKIFGYKGDLDILISQIVRLKGGLKLSKRKGQIITLEWLIKEVGLEAARFFYLIQSLDSQMEFNLQLAKERSKKSPVYYVQYAHARICGILRKFKIGKSKFKIKIQNLKLLEHPRELELIKELIRFPEIIEDTAKDYQVQRIPQYALELATFFHQFYHDCKVLTENKILREARLSLTLATKIVLKNTLDLMGIPAPERM